MDSDLALDTRSSFLAIIEGRPFEREAQIPESETELPKKLIGKILLEPSLVKFTNVFDDETYTRTIRIQNISKKTVSVLIKKLRTTSFSMSEMRKLKLAPGMSKSVVLTFRCAYNSPFTTTIPITVDDIRLEIPVFVCRGMAELRVDPNFLNFGLINQYSPAVSKEITISNQGSCPLRYTIDVAPSDLGVNSYPNKGRLRPFSDEKVNIQIIPHVAGKFEAEFWVKSQDEAVRVGLEVEIIVPTLISHHPNTTGDFTLLEFPPTFHSAMRYETIVILNKSALPSTFIVVAEIRNEIIDLKMAKKRNINYNMFSINPSEGRIESLEGRIFVVEFKPLQTKRLQGWKINLQPKEVEYLCFFKILPVQVYDHSGSDELTLDVQENIPPKPEKDKALTALDDRSVKSNESLIRANPTSEGLRLCLHGVLVNPVMIIVPDSLHFPDITVNTEVIRVLNFKNNSSLRFGYRYMKAAYVDIEPSTEYIEAGKSLEVVAKIKIKALGNYKNKLYFDLFSSYNMTDKEGTVSVGKSSVQVDCTVKTIATKPVPKINIGITPKITHEVGFLGQDVTFSSGIELPRNAIVPVGGHLPRYHSSSALIAFPNDRPQSVRGYHHIKMNSRTIFTGIERYHEPIVQLYGFTEEEKQQIRLHKDFYAIYMRETARRLRPPLKEGTLEYIISCKSLYQYKNYKPPPMSPLTLKTTVDVSGQSLVPLTPLQLYNIKVMPRELNFYQVAVNTDCEELMWVENLNNFLILIRILPGHSGVHIQGKERITIGPRQRGAFTVVLHTETLGKYNGSFKYIINENHLFEMPVYGEIINKLLTMEPEELIFSEPKENVFYTWSNSVLLSNPLKTSTKFTWILPENCKSFRVYPKAGTVPSLGKMYCVVYFIPNFSMEFTARINLRIESGIMFTLKCSSHQPKPDVFFINPLLNVGNLPVRLRTTEKTVLFNASYHEVPFQITNLSNITDVSIDPSKGYIKPRSAIVFTLEFSISNIGPFDKNITVSSNDTTTELRIVGQIIFPYISVSPREMRLQRVRCNSFISHAVVIENVSVTVANIAFEMRKYIHFKISLSSKHWEAGLSEDGFIIKPGETQKLYLHFIPEDLATYEYYLPLKINNIIGPPYIDIASSWKPLTYVQLCDSAQAGKTQIFIPERIPCMALECTVAPAKITFNKTRFTFYKNTVYDKTKDELIFTNPQTKPLVFCIGCTKYSSPFKLTFKTTGTSVADDKGNFIQLQPGESLSVMVIFKPKTYGYFEDNLPIMLKDIDKNYMKQPYNCIQFYGDYQSPSLSCPTPLVFFAPVPLQVEAVRSLSLLALNYSEEDSIEIDEPSEDKEMKTLIFNFVDGTNIPVSRRFFIQFTLSFYSLETISFKKEIHIRDKHNRMTSFTVIATADNCIITTHAFLTTKPLYGLNRVKYTDVIDMSDPDVKHASIGSSTVSQSILKQDRLSRKSGSKKIASTDDYSSVSLSTKSLTDHRHIQFHNGLSDVNSECLSSYSAMSQNKNLEDSGHINNNQGKNETTKQSQMVDSMSGGVSSEATTGTTSVTASLLLKQTIPTRLINYYAIQDYPNGFDHLRTVQKAIERFLYEQVFHCSYYWEIGTNIKWSTAYKPAQQGAAARNATLVKSLIEILERLFGKDIRTKFGHANIVLPKEEVARVQKIHSTLQAVLTFIRSQGALMSHVEAKYLLDYDDYLIFMANDCASDSASSSSPEKDKVNPKLHSVSVYSSETNATAANTPTQLCPHEFSRITHQCWLEVMLQIYKSLVLNVLPSSTKNSYSSEACKSSKDKKITSPTINKRRNTSRTKVSDLLKEKVNHNIYGRAEISILAWLNNHYERQRIVLWGHSTPPESRLICNFVDSLEDGLVFAAITASYCPYIAPLFLEDMYTEPMTKEEKHHNVVCVTKAWCALRIGFTVHPSDFVHPNSVLMLMICVHLYKVLPTYLPESIIKFSTPLTTDTEHNIPLTNSTNSRIMYSVRMFGDPHDFFKYNYTSNPLMLLKPKEKLSINVKFSARKTTKVTATMLVCGVCVSPFFGPNHVFTLEGSATEFQISITFNLSAPLNKLSTVNLPIQSPYFLDSETEFDVWYAEKKPTTENFEAAPWSEVMARKAPRRLFCLDSKLFYDAEPGKNKKESITNFKIKIGCFTPKPRQFWLIFMHESIGDFIVQILIKPKTKEMKEVIKIELTQSGPEECGCSYTVINPAGQSATLVQQRMSWTMHFSYSCPQRTVIPIPSRNDDLWHTLKFMFELTLDETEKDFWSSHLETNIGLKLVQWMVGDEVDSVSEEINHIFQTDITYNVACSSSYISMPPVLHIPDVRLQSPVNLPVHINYDAPEDFIVKVVLTASHKKEIRIYKLNFVRISEGVSESNQTLMGKCASVRSRNNSKLF